ncbi:TlpA family protein disulfide reductase [Carboxylicivirga sp. RSCT41]|uniref:TlpA family protein disulfide reductase n=1 Tax=Carboxylicivirga agarovorans TaxID=3417570 RepID=UPI003D3377F7
MKKLNILVLLIALIGLYSCNNAPKITTVEINVGEDKSRIYVNVLNQRFDLYKDTTGIAVAELDVIKEPCFAKVEVGGIQQDIYLEPGSSVKINLENRRDIIFEGDQSKVNTFINERIKWDIASESYQLPYAEFLLEYKRSKDTYGKLVDSQTELKKAASLIKQNDDYKRWNGAILKYIRNKKVKSDNEIAEILRFVREQSVASMRFTNVLSVVDRAINLLYEQDEPGYRSYEWYEGTKVKLKWLNDNIQDTFIKQHFMYAAIETYIQYNGIDKGGELFKLFNDYVDDQALLDKFKTKFNAFKKISKGSEVPEFKLTDVNGNTRRFSEFSGQYVYIDLWATWCSKCIEQFPYLEKLNEEYKDKNIVFLGLNTDMKFGQFTNYLEKINIHGEQWYIGRNKDFDTFFEVLAQPRFILLDPNGRIYDAHMLRADKPEVLKSYLNKLEGI